MGADPVPWTTVARTTLVADRWIRVHADECLDEHARRIAPYYVLEYGDWVSVLAVDRDGAAIVVEEYRHGAGVLALGTIGGGAEPGERPEDAATRELREETGCVADELVALGATWANFGTHTNKVHHFLALGCIRVTEQSLDEHEAVVVRSLPLDLVGEQLTQSYHQLTWYKAMDRLRR